MWIFTIGSIFFSLAKITSAVQRKKQIFEEFKRIGCIDKNITYDPSYEKAYVSLQSIQIIFCLVQSCFVQTFISLRFKSSWKIYYSLLLIVLANISQWAHYFAEIYLTEDTGQMESYYTTCDSDELVRTIKPYCAPIKMEYFLLSMICIAELWPSNHIHVHEANLLKSNSGSEYTPLLLSSHYRINRRGFYSCRTILCIGFVILTILPCYTFGFIKLSTDINKSKDIQSVDVAYDIFLSFSKTILLITSFYMISQSSSFLKPFMRTKYLDFHHKMIIASF